MTASPKTFHGHARLAAKVLRCLRCLEERIMKITSITKLCAVSLLAVSAAGCSTWDGMSHRQKATVTGAGIGGVAGAVITNGGVLGTVGGAAIGGVIGNQVGK
jgi:osmotically inducible lipoprotein OsmB